MSSLEPTSNTQVINLLRDAIDLLSITHSVASRLRECYVNQLASIRTAHAAPVAGEIIDPIPERTTLQAITELDGIISDETRFFQACEVRLQQLHCGAVRAV